MRLIIAIATVFIIAWYAYLGHVPLGLYPTPEEQVTLDKGFELSGIQSIKEIENNFCERNLSASNQCCRQ